MRAALAVLAATCVTLAAQAQKVRDGEEVRRNFATPHPYAAGEAHRPVWSDRLHHAGASYIQPHFSRFELAGGDFVIVRSPGGERSWRYEGLGRGGYGRDPRGFWSARIAGDTAIVELHARSGGGFGYEIDRFVRGYAADELHEPVPTTVCGTDDSESAKCYEQSEPLVYQRSRTVSRIHLPGGFVCTGWLLGCAGHLITNAHCIGDVFDVVNSTYEFLAEGPTCEIPCPTSQSCPGPIEATSGTLIRTDADLDYTLIQLPDDISGTYGYLTLRTTGPQPDERIYIPQHAGGGGKRIAVFSDHAEDASGFCEIFSTNETPCFGGPGDVGHFCDTKTGSSGAPILAYSDHRVVSLHHCGSCPNTGVNGIDLIASLGADLPDCALVQHVGAVVLDRSEYGCAESIGVTVLDDSIQGAGTQAVTLASDSEPVAETVVLAEQEPGVFSGAFPTTAQPAAVGDGKLTVAHGDTIVAGYVDADDGEGNTDVPRQDTAAADCSAPPVPIPDGSVEGAMPVLVDRLTSDGSALAVHWDDQCSPVETHLLWGALDQVATYALGGALCDMVQPQLWDPAPGGDVWFVLAGKNGVGRESSWGSSSFGERNGTSPSGACGTLAKHTAGSCP